MGIESPSLVRLLDNLAKKSLIERRTDPNDRRSNTLYLTKKSEALFEQLDVLSKQARESVLKDVSNEDIKTCIRVFEKILSAQPNE
jgi:MarR family transcriptional regulator for hemolysin